MHHKFYLGNVIDCLKAIPHNTVQTVVTSPPYFGLRDYGLPPTEWPEITYSPMTGIPSITIPPMICCHGLEPDPFSFIAHEVYVFREIRRILRPDGTIWVNLGDSYVGATSNYGTSGSAGKNSIRGKRSLIGMPSDGRKERNANGLPMKNLVGIPWRVAFALQADGWYLRSDIIWSKPNPMPSSTKDRPTLSHEYIFLLSKKAHYYYDNEAIKEEGTTTRPELLEFGPRPNKGYPGHINDRRRAPGNWQTKKVGLPGESENRGCPSGPVAEKGKRNKRTVWEIATESFSGTHFATFPTKLVEPCILAGSSPKACPKCRAPWKRVLEPSENYAKLLGKSYHDHSDDLSQGMSQQKKMPRTFADYNTVDWEPTCKCEGNDGSGKCIVLDPFGGSGTTTLVSQYLGRDSIYIDLNPAYLDIALKRNDFDGLLHADTWEIINLTKKQEAIS